jgi:hypothetical protein
MWRKTGCCGAALIVVAALDAAESLATLSERGRRVPELDEAGIRELSVLRYRLIYEVHRTEVHVLAFCTEPATLTNGGWRFRVMVESG